MSNKENIKELNEDLVRKLAEILTETGLTEIEYGSGDWHVRVSKTPAPIASFSGGGIPAAPVATGSGEGKSPAASSESLSNHPGVVVSPMVGVAYTLPDPDSAPFVQVGDSVNQGDTVILIEAMKVFNSIKAPRSGKVTRILISNGAPVEFGEPLMIIE